MANFIFLPSQNVKAFPSAYRDTSVNAEANLPTEFNLTHTSAIGLANSYLVSNKLSEQNNKITCILGGYYFEFNFVGLDINNYKYACIKLQEINFDSSDTNSQYSFILSNLSSNASSYSLDNYIDDTLYFTGVGFTNDDSDLADYIYLDLMSDASKFSMLDSHVRSSLNTDTNITQNFKTDHLEVDSNIEADSNGTLIKKATTISDGLTVNGEVRLNTERGSTEILGNLVAKKGVTLNSNASDLTKIKGKLEVDGNAHIKNNGTTYLDVGNTDKQITISSEKALNLLAENAGEINARANKINIIPSSSLLIADPNNASSVKYTSAGTGLGLTERLNNKVSSINNTKLYGNELSIEEINTIKAKCGDNSISIIDSPDESGITIGNTRGNIALKSANTGCNISTTATTISNNATTVSTTATTVSTAATAGIYLSVSDAGSLNISKQDTENSLVLKTVNGSSEISEAKVTLYSPPEKTGSPGEGRIDLSARSINVGNSGNTNSVKLVAGNNTSTLSLSGSGRINLSANTITATKVQNYSIEGKQYKETAGSATSTPSLSYYNEQSSSGLPNNILRFGDGLATHKIVFDNGSTGTIGVADSSLEYLSKIAFTNSKLTQKAGTIEIAANSDLKMAGTAKSTIGTTSQTDVIGNPLTIDGKDSMLLKVNNGHTITIGGAGSLGSYPNKVQINASTFSVAANNININENGITSSKISTGNLTSGRITIESTATDGSLPGIKLVHSRGIAVQSDATAGLSVESTTNNSCIMLRPAGEGVADYLVKAYRSFADGVTFASGTSAATKDLTFTVTAGGVVTAQAFNNQSDIRKKTNIQDYVPEKSILDLPIKKFDFIDGRKNNIGCIAQDLQKICPEIVHEDSDGYLSIEESKLVYLLLAEVKALKEEVQSLKGR